MGKRNTLLGLLAQTITLPFIAIAFFMLMRGVSGYDATNHALNKANVQEIVEKYVIQCYASEGSYPPDLRYLVDNYGLILDEERYIYEYNIFAANIMPDIIVHDAIPGDDTP